MFQTDKTIRLHHTDGAGVIYFAQLFTLAHECYEAFLDTVLPLRTILDQGQILMPITHAEADYQKPIRVGDRLAVTVTLGAQTEHSFTLNYTFKKGETQVATASTRHVVVSADFSGKSKIPAELRQALETLAL
ncbi:MAG: acyl-CoA thioesterase [Phycisphaeraceae bacterium]|nr:acyl-CoA thioesterase [Phycisphaeraceae bacterium]